jgi:hypothetical protein
MKKHLAVLLASALLPAALFAKGHGGHPMAGCGLGYMLLGNPDNSKPTQILAATTNGTSGSQTFGITSGTSGCTEDGAVKWVKEAEVYAEINLKDLSREMAAGRGEFLNGFAALMGVPASKTADFAAFTREKYSSLFTAANTSSVEMLSNLVRELSSRPDLLG